MKILVNGHRGDFYSLLRINLNLINEIAITPNMIGKIEIINVLVVEKELETAKKEIMAIKASSIPSKK